MADTLEQLQARRDELEKKRESLASRVTEGDRTVQYDLDQADVALRRLDQQIAEAEGKTPVNRLMVRSRSGWSR